MVKTKATIKKKSAPKIPKPQIERVEGTNKDTTQKQVEKYQEAASKNLEGTTRVTRQERAKKVAGKDNGDSESIRSIEDAKKKDPSIFDRIKKMVKRW